MCSFGMSVGKTGLLNRKNTGVITNDPRVIEVLAGKECTGGHAHETLENGLPRLAEVYPEELVKSLAQAVRMRHEEHDGIMATEEQGREEEEAAGSSSDSSSEEEAELEVDDKISRSGK